MKCTGNLRGSKKPMKQIISQHEEHLDILPLGQRWQGTDGQPWRVLGDTGSVNVINCIPSQKCQLRFEKIKQRVTLCIVLLSQDSKGSLWPRTRWLLFYHCNNVLRAMRKPATAASKNTKKLFSWSSFHITCASFRTWSTSWSTQFGSKEHWTPPRKRVQCPFLYIYI